MSDQQMRAYGLYRGTVVDTKDPLKKRRVRMLVPQLLGDSPTEWAWPREDASTKVQVPDVAQGVWVMFEGGDLAFPVWTGTFGKTSTSKNHGLIKPVTSVANTSPYLILVKQSDGTTEVDILASLVKLAQTCKNYETRIAQLEADMPTALQNGL